MIDRLQEGMTIGEARKAVGISFDAAIGIINMNIGSMMYLKSKSV